jgi:hypothetical protein
MQHRRTERRQNRASFQYPERRTGFDRRRPSDPLRLLRERPVILLALLVGLNLLSAADWALTMVSLSHGALEANAVMNALIFANPVAAGAFKAIAMLGVTLLIWRSRRYRPILVTALGAVGVYAALMLYHAAGLASIGVL